MVTVPLGAGVSLMPQIRHDGADIIEIGKRLASYWVYVIINFHS